MAQDTQPLAPTPPASPPARSPFIHQALWCVGLGLFANAAVLLYTHSSDRSSAAFAQNLPADRLVGAKGLYMAPAQLGPDRFGLYLMDVDAGTISVYLARPEVNRFRLMSVRSFRNDRYLEDLNNESPTPKEVRKLVEQQRQREELEGKKDTIKDGPGTAPADH